MQALQSARTNKNILGEVISYLMVTAVAVRGLVSYPESRLEIAALLAVFVLLMLLEPLLRRQAGWGQTLFLLGQMAVMVGLFMLTPEGDYWAIILMPACVYVMRYFRAATAWTWITIFIATMSIMLIMGNGWINALEFIIIYVAAYLLIASYALMLKQTEAAQAQSEQLLQELKQTHAQLEAYVAQVEELTTIKERNRLARELHDAVTQSIFSMTLITRSALILQERDPQQVKDKLLQLQDLAQGALQEMRGLIYQLRTFSVEEDGLFPVLQTLIDSVNGRGDLQITLVSEQKTLPLAPAQEQELYRIIQEAVNNIVKHAQAGHAVIHVALQDTVVSAAINDDGIGFDPARLNKDRIHIGLNSMRERAQELGGTLEIITRPGQGTEVRAVVPIPDQEESS